MPMNSRKNRKVIIAPHPDDEACGCSSVLLRAKGRKDMHVIYVFSGENKLSAYYAKAEVRRAEARKAMEIGGAKELVFLGHRELGIDTKEKFDSLVEELELLFAKIMPEEIYVPAYEGGHLDHDICNAAVARAITGNAKIFEYPMYNNEISAVELALKHVKKKVTGKKPGFRAPRFLKNSKNKVITAKLSQDEKELKKKMLRCYHSQNKEDILVKTFLFDERFRSLPKYDYGKPASRFTIHRIRSKKGSEDSFYLNISGKNREIFEKAVI